MGSACPRRGRKHKSRIFRQGNGWVGGGAVGCSSIRSSGFTPSGMEWRRVVAIQSRRLVGAPYEQHEFLPFLCPIIPLPKIPVPPCFASTSSGALTGRGRSFSLLVDGSLTRFGASFIEGSEGVRRCFGGGRSELEGTHIAGVEVVSRSLGGGSSELRTSGVGALGVVRRSSGGPSSMP